MNDHGSAAWITRGVRHGCRLLPIMFNLLTDDAISLMKRKSNGVKIDSRVRFADDIAILAYLGWILNTHWIRTFDKTPHKFELIVNTQENKNTATVQRKSNVATNTKLGDVSKENVTGTEFWYLGRVIVGNNKRHFRRLQEKQRSQNEYIRISGSCCAVSVFILRLGSC